MQDCPTIWPAGSRRAGSPMLSSEREAWLMGYIAACDVAEAIIRQRLSTVRTVEEVRAPENQAPDYAAHSDVDLSKEAL